MWGELLALPPGPQPVCRRRRLCRVGLSACERPAPPAHLHASSSSPRSNIVDHPGEAKYRRVKADNTAYRSRLGCRPGGKEAMAALGFRCACVQPRVLPCVRSAPC